jgi:hypothetical protein
MKKDQSETREHDRNGEPDCSDCVGMVPIDRRGAEAFRHATESDSVADRYQAQDPATQLCDPFVPSSHCKFPFWPSEGSINIGTLPQGPLHTSINVYIDYSL